MPYQPSRNGAVVGAEGIKQPIFTELSIAFAPNHDFNQK
jgi:hypothetical protein